MGRLRFADGIDASAVDPTVVAVPIDKWTYSAGGQLATDGAGPCLNVVLHDPVGNVGCLAHIHNSARTAEATDHKAHAIRSNLYHKAYFTIREMMSAVPRRHGPFEVFLEAGQAFSAQAGPYVKEDDVNYDLPDYLTRAFLEESIAISVIDSRISGVVCQPDKGNILYHPAASRVYFVATTKNREALTAMQNGRTSDIQRSCF